jgi:hypothetical protein
LLVGLSASGALSRVLRVLLPRQLITLSWTAALTAGNRLNAADRVQGSRGCARFR